MHEAEHIRILGIVAEEITEPQNDGTPGSALYAVPLKLSRQPSSLWAELFVRTWDHPPSYTSMHRPGIARVVGDTVILDGTTVEEVDRVHKETLKLVIQEVNSRAEELERKANAKDEERERQRKEHAEKTKEAAKRIRFDE